METLRGLGAVVGAILVSVTLLDVVWTTLGARGSGPINGWVSRRLWRAALQMHRRWPNDRRLGAAGIAILLIGLMVWTLLLWLGWVLIFSGDPDAILHGSTRAPAGFWERVYFVGYSMTTLGVGDYVANGSFWRVVTIVTAIIGFFVLTVSVTYLLSVLSAVVQKRSAADYIRSLGATPAEILANHWHGENCEPILQHVPGLMQTLGTIAQQHTAYPVLHFLHAGESRSALPLRIATLSEAFLYFDAGVVRCEATEIGIRPLRKTLRQVIETISDLHLSPAPDAPPPPPPELPEGVPHERESDTGAAARDHELYRKLLLRYIVNDGWAWEQVYRGDEEDA